MNPATADKPPYWFPAKRYGWGWGLPATWQGWLVLALYFAGNVVVFVRYPPDVHVVAFPVGVIALTTALIAVCWLKGEPPRWRWGGTR